MLSSFENPSFYSSPYISSGIDLHACVYMYVHIVWIHIAIHVDSYPDIFYQLPENMGQGYGIAWELGSLGDVSIETQFLGGLPIQW